MRSRKCHWFDRYETISNHWVSSQSGKIVHEFERSSRSRLGFVEEIEMIETTDVVEEAKPKRPSTATTKKRVLDPSEVTVNELDLVRDRRRDRRTRLQMSDQQKRGRSSGHTTSGTSDFYSVASESESSYQTAGENDDFKPKFLKKLNDTLATGE